LGSNVGRRQSESVPESAAGATSLLDRLIGHDAWTTRQVIRRARELTPEQWDRSLDVGHGTVRETLHHMIGNVETWTDLMEGREVVRGSPPDPARRSLDGLAARHEAAMTRFAALVRRIAAADRLDDRWVDTLDDPPTEKSYGGAILHVVTHDHQHRAELLHMLARLGLADLPEGDLLSWELSARRDDAMESPPA
jgi:uncharacterized damage-inducible protein DinB